MTNSAIDVPRHAMRGLHSAWIDYLSDQPEWWRDALLERVQGIDHIRFALALQAQLILVAAQLDDDLNVLVGLALPGSGAADHLLFTIHGDEIGLDAAHVLAAGELRIEEELAALIAGDDE